MLWSTVPQSWTGFWNIIYQCETNVWVSQWVFCLACFRKCTHTHIYIYIYIYSLFNSSRMSDAICCLFYSPSAPILSAENRSVTLVLAKSGLECTKILHFPITFSGGRPFTVGRGGWCDYHYPTASPLHTTPSTPPPAMPLQWRRSVLHATTGELLLTVCKGWYRYARTCMRVGSECYDIYKNVSFHKFI